MGKKYYDGFTDEAQQVMAMAEEIAREWKHEYVGTESVLIALLWSSTDVVKQNRAERLLRNLGISPARVVFETCLLVKAGQVPILAGVIPHTPRVRKVIEYAIQETEGHHRNQVGTEYLLLGLLREQDGVAAQVLMTLDLRQEDMREQILCLDDEDRESPTVSSSTQKSDLRRIAEALEILVELARNNFRS